MANQQCDKVTEKSLEEVVHQQKTETYLDEDSESSTESNEDLSSMSVMRVSSMDVKKSVQMFTSGLKRASVSGSHNQVLINCKIITQEEDEEIRQPSKRYPGTKRMVKTKDAIGCILNNMEDKLEEMKRQVHELSELYMVNLEKEKRQTTKQAEFVDFQSYIENLPGQVMKQTEFADFQSFHPTTLSEEFSWHAKSRSNDDDSWAEIFIFFIVFIACFLFLYYFGFPGEIRMAMIFAFFLSVCLMQSKVNSLSPDNFEPGDYNIAETSLAPVTEYSCPALQYNGTMPFALQSLSYEGCTPLL